MKKLALSFLLVSVAAALAQQPKIQALIITGQNVHDWRGVEEPLRKALESTGRFEVRVIEEFRGGSAETLAPYDVVILNYFDRAKPELRWGERADTAFLNYVRSGKGLVVYHFSLAAFNGWEDYEKISGGNWRPDNGHHSAAHDFTVDVKDSDHPVTRGLKKSFLQPKDELYANLRWQPAGAFHVLATAWDDYSLYKNPNPKQPTPGPGKHEPMLWTTEYGKGRVFVTALGHDVPAVGTSAFVTTFTRGAEWAATGAVTLPIPPDMAQ